jgi:anti-sigma B factor antagonist
MELICSQDRLLKIFRITGLAKVFVIHETAEAALTAS